LRPGRDRALAGPGPSQLTPMGMVYEDIEDHEGYAARRLPDGTLTASWSAASSGFVGYVAACSCGWAGQHEHGPAEAGREAAEREWKAEHASPLVAEAIPASVGKHIKELRAMVAELAAERPAAARHVLEELVAWGGALGQRLSREGIP